MTNNPPILRNSALVAPFAVGVGFFFGPSTALAAAISSGVVLLNLWVLSVLGPRLVQAIARNEPGAGLFAAALVAKFLLVALATIWMASTLPPIGVALGFVPLLGGTLVTAIELARADL